MKLRKFLTLKDFRIPFHPNLKWLLVFIGKIKGSSLQGIRAMEHLTVNGVGVYFSLLGLALILIRWFIWIKGQEVGLSAPLYGSIFYLINTFLAWISFKKEPLLSFFLWGSTILLEILLIIFARI